MAEISNYEVNFEINLKDGADNTSAFHKKANIANGESLHKETVDDEQSLHLRTPVLESATVAAALLEWSESTYSSAKQLIGERLGLRSRTSDSELNDQVALLRHTHSEYLRLRNLAHALAVHVDGVVSTQRQLVRYFLELASSMPSDAATATSSSILREDWVCHSSTQDILAKNGEQLLGALKYFSSNLNTLCTATMADTFETVKRFEECRLVFDARRNEYELLASPEKASAEHGWQDEAKRVYDTHKSKFEEMRCTLCVKLKFLDENRVKVMRRQLLLFHNATSAYFTGNRKQLESSLAQLGMHIHLHKVEQHQSWLEKCHP